MVERSLFRAGFSHSYLSQSKALISYSPSIAPSLIAAKTQPELRKRVFRSKQPRMNEAMNTDNPQSVAALHVRGDYDLATRLLKSFSRPTLWLYLRFLIFTQLVRWSVSM